MEMATLVLWRSWCYENGEVAVANASERYDVQR